MNDDPYINELTRQTFRPVPPQWKSEILGTATTASKATHTKARADDSTGRKAASLREARPWLDWLWPHPAAWAGLAAAWVVILGVNVMTIEHSDDRTRAVTTPFREVQMALAEQRRMLHELLELDTASNVSGARGKAVEPREPADARPRSARIPEMAHV